MAEDMCFWSSRLAGLSRCWQPWELVLPKPAGPAKLLDSLPVSWGQARPGPPVTSSPLLGTAPCKTESLMGRSGGWDFQQIGKD